MTVHRVVSVVFRAIFFAAVIIFHLFPPVARLRFGWTASKLYHAIG
jgi:hypothetical protein